MEFGIKKPEKKYQVKTQKEIFAKTDNNKPEVYYKLLKMLLSFNIADSGERANFCADINKKHKITDLSEGSFTKREDFNKQINTILNYFFDKLLYEKLSSKNGNMNFFTCEDLQNIIKDVYDIFRNIVDRNDKIFDDNKEMKELNPNRLSGLTHASLVKNIILALKAIIATTYQEQIVQKKTEKKNQVLKFLEDIKKKRKQAIKKMEDDIEEKKKKLFELEQQVERVKKEINDKQKEVEKLKPPTPKKEEKKEEKEDEKKTVKKETKKEKDSTKKTKKEKDSNTKPPKKPKK